jgi:Tol biopolymer transport system component
MHHCKQKMRAKETAYLATLLLTLVAVAGGRVLPVASSRSLIKNKAAGRGYVKPSSRSLLQAISGGRLVFERVDIQSPTQAGTGVYIMDDDGTNLRRLNSVGVEPSLSRDGTKLSFVTGQPPSGCNNHELNIMPSIFGTDQRQLTRLCGYDQHPAWSPDGTKIAFWSDRSAGEGLYVMNADGSQQTRILSTSSIQRQIESPHWSSDGTRITFVGYNLGANNEADIFVVNADGTNPVNITNTSTIHEVAPAWSRNDNKIAYVRVTSANDSDIYTMNADGGNKTQLTKLSVTGLGVVLGLGQLKLAWSPDGTRLAFMDAGNSLDIFAINADGSNRVNLTNTPDNDTYPDWQIAAPTPTTNPIDDAQFFVRQHSRDFLTREPDAPGLAHWTGEITECVDPARRQPGESLAQCTERKRANTSAAFFFSPEFQNTGSFVLRVYWGTLGRVPAVPCPGVPFGLPGNCRPQFAEYLADASQITQGIVVNDKLAPEVINANKHAFVEQFIHRPEFHARFNGLTNTQFVDRLFETTGIAPTATERDALIAELVNGNSSNSAKASVVFKVVDGTQTITDGALVFQTRYGQAFYDKEFDSVFVFMEYLGYLRRNPDQAGYDFWLAKLKQYGNWLDAQMVLAFIVSPEYRSRFGQP